MSVENYSTAYAVAAEGYRIGLVTCKRCGCSITLDAEVNTLDLHDRWHETLDPTEGDDE